MPMRQLRFHRSFTIEREWCCFKDGMKINKTRKHFTEFLPVSMNTLNSLANIILLNKKCKTQKHLSLIVVFIPQKITSCHSTIS